MLLVGRALQGIGCAGLLINTKVILADKVSLKENARNNTTFTFVGGIGYGVGPVVGGYLTQANWRYCFIINIPIAVAGLVLVHFVLRKELLGPRPITRTSGDTSVEIPPTFRNKVATIDFVGQFFFLFGTGLFVLAITWAGAYYPWKDVKIIVPLVLSVVLISIFITWEYFFTPGRLLSLRYPLVRPMIPVSLIVSRNAGLLWYINFSAGMAMYAVFYFAGLYFVIVESLQPGEAGRNLIYYTPGLAVGAYAAMFACNVFPLKTWYPLALGSVIEPIGVTLLGLAVSKGNLPWVYGMLGLTGVGTGIRFMPG
jgi:MFS family permease